ncbi:MAG: hypothetical protein RMJ43_13995 [Chloroherpetonaceae bacterium]|nr:hypothetical protein [Chloroherpetonaceae bacterium]
MFALLVRVRLQSNWNTARDTLQRHPVLSIGLSLLGIALFAGMVLGFLVFFEFARRLHVLEETVYQIFYFLFLFLLAGAVPFVASTLLHSADYGLLFAAPVPPRAVIAAKLLDATVTNALQFMVLGVPAILAAAIAAGIPPGGWTLIPLFIALFVLLPALLTALGLLVALALAGIHRLRTAIGLLNLIMALLVCLIIVQEAHHLPIRTATLNDALTGIAPATLVHRSPGAHLAPSAWFATALLAMARGTTVEWIHTLLLACGTVGMLYLICVALGERYLTAASVAGDSDTGSVYAAPAESVNLWRRFFIPPIAALLYKDIRYLWRDSVLLSQLLMPMILFLVPFLLVLNDTARELRDELHHAAFAMILVILFMQTSILSLSALGLEARSFWILQSAPQTSLTWLLAKFLLGLLLSAGCSLLLVLASCIMLQARWQETVFQMAIVILCCAGLCGLGVGLSATFPRFIYENPAHRVSVWALVLGFFAYAGYMLLVGAFYGIAYLVSLRYGTTHDTVIAGTFAMLLHLGLTLCAVVFPIQAGAKRLASYQWEH